MSAMSTVVPVSMLRMAADAMDSAVRASWPGTTDGVPVRTASTNAVSSPSVGGVQEVGVAARGVGVDAAGVVEGHVGCCAQYRR